MALGPCPFCGAQSWQGVVLDARGHLTWPPTASECADELALQCGECGLARDRSGKRMPQYDDPNP